MSTYTLTAADHAFTLWLATRNKQKVAAEKHAHLSKSEKQVLRFHMQAIPAERKPPPPVKQSFTDRQITIALAALAARETKTRSVY